MKYVVLKAFLIALVMGTLFFNSCKKDSSEFNSVVRTQTAILDYTGSYAVDGCGYFLEIESNSYKPNNEEVIDASFQETGSMEVLIEYKYIEEPIFTNCGDSPESTENRGIHLISITRK